MSKITNLLHQLTALLEQHNSEEWKTVNLDSGLTVKEIEKYSEGEPYVFPTEILELYQWSNGTNGGSIFPSAERAYQDQEFYSLAYGLGTGEEWEQDYCPGTKLLALFNFEDIYYWTILPETKQKFAPIYCNDEPDFTVSHNYPSLEAMLEQQITRLKFVWEID